MKRKKLLNKMEKILYNYNNKRIASIEIHMYNKYGDLLIYEYKNKKIKLVKNLGTAY